ncbi:hypothetical protein BKA93DRAFT_202935 [Sparassis latifolia]|uniref:Uncharacterized protein n=1 Tax=Sparassis crispa TaxID=139825 RepID=A0A401GD60_9APHY|nr:hypothetical protein SCP_0212550 [Sparassis crispa]GBE80053.1 hypothetical protein SCP_0212550 [Sparassis crispa]
MSIKVDDADPSITYSTGWTFNISSAQYDDTYHGATKAGMTATFTFTGISVAAYGSLGSWDVFGRPVTSYTIDGNYISAYQAPIVDPPYYTVNTLYFQSSELSQGTHTLVITNLNGTPPSEFWLDYVIYLPGAATTAPASTPTTDSPPPPPATTPLSSSPSPTPPGTSPPPGSPPESSSSSPSLNFPSSPSANSGPTSPGASASTDLSSSSSNHPTSPSSSPSHNSSTELTSLTPGYAASSPSAFSHSGGTSSAADHSSTGISAAASKSKTPIGAIAGGSVGGVVGLVVLLLLFFLLWRRRGRRSGEDVRPFASWRHDPEPARVPFVYHKSPLPGTSHNPPEMVATASVSSPESVSSTSSGSVPSQQQPVVISELTSVVTHQHEDSGVRLAPAPVVVEVPPAYTHA